VTNIPPTDISIRVASYAAAQCVKHFCKQNDISDERIFLFCSYLEDAATATDVPNWDAAGKQLAITGLGDQLPDSLSSVASLSYIIEHAREVTASQLYVEWTPEQVTSFLSKCTRVSGFDFSSEISSFALAHRPGPSGWGDPVTIAIRNTWSTHV